MNDKSFRVFRGGSWYFVPRLARVADRVSDSPGYRSVDLGLRLVEVIDDPASTPTASESNRVIRGGGWVSDPQNARVALRGNYSPGYRSYDLGLRLVEVVDD